MKSLIRTKHSLKVLTMVSKAIFTCQLAKNYLHEIKFTPYYSFKLKFNLNVITRLLEEVEQKEFKLAYEKVDEETYSLTELKQDLIEEIVDLGPGHYKNITLILQDYKKHMKELSEQKKAENGSQNGASK